MNHNETSSCKIQELLQSLIESSTLAYVFFIQVYNYMSMFIYIKKAIINTKSKNRKITIK